MSPTRLHRDFHFMVSVILELGGERLALKNSCAGGPVGNSNSETLMYREAAEVWVCPGARAVLMSTFTALLHYYTAHLMAGTLREMI